MAALLNETANCDSTATSLQSIAPAALTDDCELFANEQKNVDSTTQSGIEACLIQNHSELNDTYNAIIKPETLVKTEEASAFDGGPVIFSGSHQCTLCQATFINWNLLNRHMIRRHSSDITPSYPCQHCSLTFGEQADLDDHCIRIHTAFRCKLCHQLFETSRLFEEHVRTHLTVQCDTCSKDFDSGKALEKHKRVQHGERRHQCPLCGKRYASLGFLARHLRNTHVHDKDKRKLNLTEVATASDANATASNANATTSDANTTVSDANATVSDANATVSVVNTAASNVS